MKTLQRRWTTFLKAQLVCEDRASGQRFNVLTDVFTVQHQRGDPSSTHFYGIFTSQWYIDPSHLRSDLLWISGMISSLSVLFLSFSFLQDWFCVWPPDLCVVLMCREREELSAVCVYSLEEITKVLNGPFKELKKSCENWINPEPIPIPRPGQVYSCTLTTTHFSIISYKKML